MGQLHTDVATLPVPEAPGMTFITSWPGFQIRLGPPLLGNECRERHKVSKVTGEDIDHLTGPTTENKTEFPRSALPRREPQARGAPREPAKRK